MADLTTWLRARDACGPAMEWLAAPGLDTPEAIVAACPCGDWLLWLAECLGYAPAVLTEAVRPAVLRAAREYAPAALDRAGLPNEAARLRALPDDAPLIEVWGAARRAARAADAAEWAVADAAYAAARAAEWAAWVAWAADAARAAQEAEDAARAAGLNATAEPARCADEVRAALPGLAARWRAALESAHG